MRKETRAVEPLGNIAVAGALFGLGASGSYSRIWEVREMKNEKPSEPNKNY